MSFTPPNHTQTPNKIFALLPLMGEAELKVTLVIVRDTFGWQAGGSATVRSLTVLMELTGLSRQGVLNGLNAGIKRGTLYRTSGDSNKAAYGLVVNEVDRSTGWTGQPSRPKLVNLVDRDGQPSRPQVVNEVDRSTGTRARSSAGKADPERKRKERERKEREEERSPAPPSDRSASDQQGKPEQGTGGADRAGDPDGSQPGTPDPAQVQPSAPAGVNGQSHDNKTFPGGPATMRPGEKFLRTQMGDVLYEECLTEDPDREAWGNLTPEQLKDLKTQAKNEAAESNLRKWRTPFIALLDKAIAPSTRPAAPTRASVTDLVRQRLQGGKS